jgi:hypothetical protein
MRFQALLPVGAAIAGVLAWAVLTLTKEADDCTVIIQARQRSVDELIRTGAVPSVDEGRCLVGGHFRDVERPKQEAALLMVYLYQHGELPVSSQRAMDVLDQTKRLIGRYTPNRGFVAVPKPSLP